MPDAKERILNALIIRKGEYVSGASLAKELNVSRNAIWKSIESLRKDGFAITAVSNKGYALPFDTDILNAHDILRYLPADKRCRIEVYKTVSSTNDTVKARATQGEKEGLIVISEEQTAGKGRKDRNFFSPSGTGIYLSILLRPSIPAAQALSITTIAAVAVAEAIEKVAHKDAKIKWVNDVFIDNKKVCGILTEASLDLESGGLDYCVLGIGINVRPPFSGWPIDISTVATSVFDNNNYVDDARNRLVAKVIERFFYYYKDISGNKHIEKYREKSLILGRRIKVISGDSSKDAVALAINDDCSLSVRYTDGRADKLNSGEVSIKL